MRFKVTTGLVQGGILLRYLVAAELAQVGKEDTDSTIIPCALMRSLPGSVYTGSICRVHLRGACLLGNGRVKGFSFFLVRAFGQLPLDALDKFLGRLTRGLAR